MQNHDLNSNQPQQASSGGFQVLSGQPAGEFQKVSHISGKEDTGVPVMADLSLNTQHRSGVKPFWVILMGLAAVAVLIVVALGVLQWRDGVSGSDGDQIQLTLQQPASSQNDAGSLDDGLSTEPASSNRSYVFNTAGAVNVAQVDAQSGYGQSAVSMEQVLEWNPQIIITQGTTNAYETILSDPNWASIDAVKNGRVYKMPSQPYSWADRPPSVNRFIGLKWMANLLYPDLYDIDIVEEAIEYYDVMYHVEVSREDMEALLADAIPQS